MNSKDATAGRENAELDEKFVKDRADPDVKGFVSTTDNVGKGARVRYETTTQHSLPLRQSNLPLSVQQEVAAAGDSA